MLTHPLTDGVNVWPHTSSELLTKAHAIAGRAHITSPNGIRHATRIIDALRCGETSAILAVAPGQAHKTTASIMTMLLLPTLYSEAKNIGVYFLTNKSNTDIFEKNKAALEHAGFDIAQDLSENNARSMVWHKRLNGVNLWVCTTMLSTGAWDSLNNKGRLKAATFKLRLQDCTHFAFLMDEVQCSVQKGQQLDRFLTEYLKIKTPTAPAIDFTPPTVFIGLTATPLRHFLIPVFDMPLLVVAEKPREHEGHTGLDKLRLKMTHIERREFTTATDVVQLLRDDVQSTKRKIFVIRVPSKTSRKHYDPEDIVIEAAIKLGFKEPNIISCNSLNRNLRWLADPVTSPFRRAPDDHLMIILKDGIGAGITISTDAHIGAWVELRYNNPESLVQSLVRMNGYKRKLGYNIYCDTDVVDAQLRFEKKLYQRHDFTDEDRIEHAHGKIKFNKHVLLPVGVLKPNTLFNSTEQQAPKVKIVRFTCYWCEKRANVLKQDQHILKCKWNFGLPPRSSFEHIKQHYRKLRSKWYGRTTQVDQSRDDVFRKITERFNQLQSEENARVQPDPTRAEYWKNYKYANESKAQPQTTRSGPVEHVRLLL
jgi:hypothetical protein